MSECTKSLDELLDADVDELRGRADTELSRHVSHCTRCGAAARRILASNAALDRALASAPSLDVEAVLARARLATAPDRDGASTRRPGVPDSSGPRWQRWHAWAGLAAAASLAALVLLSVREPSLPGTPGQPLTNAQAMVEAPPDRDVAVIQTDNPDITVLWFF
jgi:hypothetical protein